VLTKRNDLRARTNANEVIGYPPGTLLMASVGGGGGFSGLAGRATVWVRMTGWPEELFPRVDFPPHGEHSPDLNYDVWQEDGMFYLEKHRLEYGWTLPVTEEQKRGKRT